MIDPRKTPVRNNAMRKEFIKSARDIRRKHGSCVGIDCGSCVINAYEDQEGIRHRQVFIPESEGQSDNWYKTQFVKRFLERYDPSFKKSLGKKKK